MRIAVYVGSRANFGRLKCLLDEIIGRNHILDLIEGSFTIPDEYKQYVKVTIDSAMYNDTKANMGRTSAITTLEAISYFQSNKPDFYLVHGDRFENLGPTLAASYLSIPVGHIEAGDISGNIDNKIRYAITAMADLCFPISKKAAIRCEKMGKTFVCTGSPGIDLAKKVDEDGMFMSDKPYVLVVYNPCEQDDCMEFINAIKSISELSSVLWINPNADPGNKAILKEIHRLENTCDVEFLKDIGPQGFINLMNNCDLLIGNTSAGIKEGAFLGVPYLLVGDRQKGRDTTVNVIRAKCNRFEILSKFDRAKTLSFESRVDFGNGNASKLIVDAVERWDCNE
jgi:UDP-hydrolysing UDP-N-acetyl-D-glucosamine 2-epimerase